jgi:hypothetical protein
MPAIPPALTNAELACIQAWANELTEPSACPITCQAGTTCVNVAAGQDFIGRWSCMLIPQLCEGVPNCGCLTSCRQCQQKAGYVRCFEAA